MSIEALESRLLRDMQAAIDDRWVVAPGCGIGLLEKRQCCAIGASVRDCLASWREDNAGDPVRTALARLGISIYVYDRIAEGFDCTVTPYPKSRYVALGRRLREAARTMNARCA